MVKGLVLFGVTTVGVNTGLEFGLELLELLLIIVMIPPPVLGVDGTDEAADEDEDTVGDEDEVIPLKLEVSLITGTLEVVEDSVPVKLELKEGDKVLAGVSVALLLLLRLDGLIESESVASLLEAALMLWLSLTLVLALTLWLSLSLVLKLVLALLLRVTLQLELGIGLRVTLAYT